MATTQILEPGFFTLLFNFYGYYIFYILFALWAPLALIDLSKRDDVTPKQGSLWAAAIVLVPLIGAGAYHIAGGSKIPSWAKTSLVYGGIGLLALTLVISTIARF
ncbi:PLDc N-terminal domain-containing protein [Leptospira wolffii]|uniref:PLDc N-terminal domain-containing protein n=1 Tax=Leptospira wolffii TaxID=409998 RepID=A0A2M9ZD13_9LEPT|nr:PLDc N-terminal domain-containing protein [Leptospira wolffii]EPG67653.1 phospholipase D-nuclease N-terminal domain protein [Leptospira wolffii serovar Khorat str. Khorat-H2]PJZ66242.1 phospholipase [Leptospira wolffii]TGK60205.1 phospholipase [Leptospira wolffii]TGK72547.1 phospholipase [Leptospira wolffii]TGK76212.1 phospholipase [Leptospira wolffii]